ncbi:hypothetical protein GM98_16235 [Salmonella enterica subsp. enterica serovar Dublin]|nr:hypothetical protein [Salmonella enterica subsp. enterica serovar Dublin]
MSERCYAFDLFASFTGPSRRHHGVRLRRTKIKLVILDGNNALMNPLMIFTKIIRGFIRVLRHSGYTITREDLLVAATLLAQNLFTHGYALGKL